MNISDLGVPVWVPVVVVVAVLLVVFFAIKMVRFNAVCKEAALATSDLDTFNQYLQEQGWHKVDKYTCFSYLNEQQKLSEENFKWFDAERRHREAEEQAYETHRVADELKSLRDDSKRRL